MFEFINPLSYFIQLELSKYVLGAFACFGIMLCLKLLIFKRGL